MAEAIAIISPILITNAKFAVGLIALQNISNLETLRSLNPSLENSCQTLFGIESLKKS